MSAASSRGVIGGAVAGEGAGLPWEAAAGGFAPAPSVALTAVRQAGDRLSQIALQTLQCGSAAGRNAGAVRLIVAAARLPDRVRLRLARLLRARRPRQRPADQTRDQCQPNQRMQCAVPS